jgi:hypothetical protein
MRHAADIGSLLRAGGPNGAAWCLGSLIRVVGRRSTGRRCGAQSVWQGMGALQSAGSLLLRGFRSGI